MKVFAFSSSKFFGDLEKMPDISWTSQSIFSSYVKFFSCNCLPHKNSFPSNSRQKRARLYQLFAVYVSIIFDVNFELDHVLPGTRLR